MQISIKPIYDWSIYLTASADERLACIMQTSFHYTTLFMNPFLATVAQNRMKKALREMQTLRAGCSKVEPKIFAPPPTPFPGAQDSHKKII